MLGNEGFRIELIKLEFMEVVMLENHLLCTSQPLILFDKSLERKRWN